MLCQTSFIDLANSIILGVALCFFSTPHIHRSRCSHYLCLMEKVTIHMLDVWRICICKKISKHGQRNDAKSIVVQYVHCKKIDCKKIDCKKIDCKRYHIVGSQLMQHCTIWDYYLTKAVCTPRRWVITSHRLCFHATTKHDVVTSRGVRVDSLEWDWSK